MGELREDRQSQFFTWLSSIVSPAQLSELYQAFSDLEDILASHRYYHRLSHSLAETTDAADVDTLYNDLNTNRIFMNSYRSGVKLSLLRYYARYCRESKINGPSAQSKAQSKNETSSGDSLIDRLKKEGIPYADKRLKNGVLWVAQSSGTDKLIKDFRAQGMQFTYSATKKQWWTRDSSPASPPKKDSVNSSAIQTNQQAFVAWLKHENYDTLEQFSIYGTVRKIHKMMLSAGMPNGLFGIHELEGIRSCAITAQKKYEFIQGNRAERGLWKQALNCYLRFAEEGLTPVTQIPVAEKTIPKRIEPAILQPENKQATVEQHRPEKQFSALTSEEGFRFWLAEQKPQENADSIIAVLHAAEQFSQHAKLFGITPSIVKPHVHRLMISRTFANADRRRYREFNRVGSLLIDYADSIVVPEQKTSVINVSAVTPAPAFPEAKDNASADAEPQLTEVEAKSTAVTEPTLPEVETKTVADTERALPEMKSDTSSDMDPALIDLLRDEQFTDLRKAVFKRGIRKLDDFKRLNLWIFMNQNGLYSIGQRQIIYSTIRHKLESVSRVNNQAKWKLVTKENEYTGASPAEALMAYCRVMATKYPLRFRNIIGIPIFGTGLIPLMRNSVHEDDPCLEHPKAYINSKLDADNAKLFARWIAKSCRDADEPISVTCVAPVSNNEAGITDNWKQTGVVEPLSVQIEEAESISLDAFKTFLIVNQRLTEKTAKIYLTSIRMVEEYLKRNHLGYSLDKTNADQAQQITDLLLMRNDFVQINNEHYRQYSTALFLFILFLRQDGNISPFGKSNPMSAKSHIEPPKSSTPAKPHIEPPKPSTPVESHIEPPKLTEHSPMQNQVERMVVDADLEGQTLDQLCIRIPNATMTALKQIANTSPNLVDMGGKLIHVDAFVDWDEAAEKLHDILEKLLMKNNGYVSNTQLWDYAKTEMHMFLNDNDISDMWSLYYIARHMFEKTNWHGVHYVFSSNGHISQAGENVLSSNLDVIRKFARENNGFFRYDDLVEYLESVGIKTGNLRVQMRIGAQPIFFYYNEVDIISVESMGIDETWLNQVEQALKRLFSDVGDHIVLRDINPIWFEQLPTLPAYRPWTMLLLQYVLIFYGKRLGAKTICSELNQNYCRLHAMLVTQNSVVQTFADAVAAYLVDSEIEQRQFEAEELRGILLKGGLITGNELIWHVPKAIGSDPRFAWDMSGQKVKVQV